MLIRIIVRYFALSLVLICPASLANVSFHKTVERDVQDWIHLASSLRSTISRDSIDSEALLDAYDYEADGIVTYVTNAIRFEAYSGLMKGAKGALATAAGNALDQSVLLASLLKDAGFDARIVYRKLTADQARLLLVRLNIEPAEQPAFAEAAAEVFLDMARFGRSRDMKPDNQGYDHFLESLSARHRTLVSILQPMFESTQSPKRTAEEAIDAALDYFWVQYRAGKSDPWANAHPAWPDAEKAISSNDLLPQTYYTEAVPETWQQRLSVRLMASRSSGSQQETLELTAPWVRPVANLFGINIALEVLPASPLAKGADATSRSTMLFPRIAGALAPSAQAFNLGGNVVPPDVAASNMAGVFATGADKLDGAASAIGGLGGGSSSGERRLRAITDVWWVFELVQPNAEPIRWTRSFQRDGRDLALSDFQKRLVLELSFGEQTLASRTDRLLGRHIESMELALDQHRASRTGFAQEASLDLARATMADSFHQGANPVFAGLSETYADTPKNSVSYRTSPLIALHHLPLRADADARTGIDIVSNQRTSVKIDSGNQILERPLLTLHAGLWEALSEAEAMASEAGAEVVSAATLTLAAGAVDGYRLITSRAEIEELETPELVRQTMIERVNVGHVLIIPPTAEAIRAWWEINPVSGHVLGRTDNFWGGSYTAISSITTERLAVDAVTRASMCAVWAFGSCRSYSKWAVATLTKATILGGKGACMYIMSNLPIPPGMPDPCDYIDLLPAHLVTKLLSRLEAPIFNKCFEVALPFCIKATGPA